MTSTTGQVIVDPSGQEDFVVNAETIVKEAIYFDVNKSISFGSTVQGALKIGGFQEVQFLVHQKHQLLYKIICCI